jgi:hypothetical protein
MEAAASSDAQRYIPAGDISTHRCENLKYCLLYTFWCFGTLKMTQTEISEVMQTIFDTTWVTEFRNRSHLDKIVNITFLPYAVFD